ncbi:MAG: ring-cleaving dioxygenase, partial [Mesorhizobium sp.]
MLNQIQGLHHVTSMASDARRNNEFFTKKLGLRRVKKTVNFDAPDVYHLYYADEVGTPGSVMTYFPFPDIGKGRHGVGEVGTTVFSVPEGTLAYWEKRFTDEGVGNVARTESFGEKRLTFTGPDGDSFALVEDKADSRAPWVKGGVPGDEAIRGFHSVSLRLKDGGATEELLKFMGYEEVDKSGNIRRLAIKNGNG